MYGLQLWDITSPTVEKVYTLWKIAHRQVLEMPNMTHCSMLPLIADNIPLECILDCIYIAFYKSIAKSEKKQLYSLTQTVLSYIYIG